MIAIANGPQLPALAETPWTLEVLEAVDSTNTFAARRPAWTAVRARTQTAGRGRTRDRRWVSDEGGLWLSAVLPCPGPRNRWETLPLVAGAAVIDAVSSLGVSGARLRWPNDVMLGDAKLAGLLVERYTEETAVVGIGLNVFNRPERANAELAGHTARLCTLVGGEYTVDDVARTVLWFLRRSHSTMLMSGFDPIAAELNRAWAKPRDVEVTFSGSPVRRALGSFLGVDGRGRLRISTAGSAVEIYDATQIALLREVA